MILKALSMLSIYILPLVLILFQPMPDWVIFPLSVMMGVGMAGIGMSVMHDAAHGSFSKSGWLNKLFAATMYFIGGNIFNWRVQHNIMHHTFTNVEGFDEDIEQKGSLRLSPHTQLKKFHRYQHIYAFFLYCLMTLSRAVSEFGQLIRYNRSGLTHQQGSTPVKEMFRLIISKAAYLFIILVLPLIVSGYSWWLVILGFLIMHLVAGFFMSVVFQMAHVVEGAEHPLPDVTGNIYNEWTIHELETTVNFAPKSRFLGWMIGGLNYQIEHHLFPNICHVHYKAISPIVEKTAKEFGLRYNQHTTFLNAIVSHVRMLKRLGGV